MKSVSNHMFRVLCGVLLALATTVTADEAQVQAKSDKNLEAGYANGGQQRLPAIPPAGAEKSKKLSRTAKSMHSKIMFTNPPAGTLHTSVSFSEWGDEIILEDGSKWEVNKEDTYKVMHWSSIDQVVITPNDDFFSKYDGSWNAKYIFRMVNVNKQISVAVRMKTFLALPFHTVYNHRLATYSDYERILWLEDGSAWKVDSWDFDICKQWAIGHTLVIGVNDGFLASWSPSILICADRNEFVRCKCER